MTAPQKATPRWHGADAEQTSVNAHILPDTAAACQAEHQRRVQQADARLQALRRAFAAKQFELYVIADAGNASFLVSRWGQMRQLDSLAALESFARHAGIEL